VEEEKRRKTENHLYEGLFMICATSAIHIVIGLIILAVTKDLWKALTLPFLLTLFGYVPAFLTITKTIPTDLSFGFGCGLIFGSGAINRFLTWFLEIDSSIDSLCVSIVICALTCWIIYLTQFK